MKRIPIRTDMSFLKENLTARQSLSKSTGVKERIGINEGGCSKDIETKRSGFIEILV